MEDAIPPDHRMRASDADRDRLVAALEAHTAAGRLSLDEYSDRVAQVFEARTRGDLAAVMRDLPQEPAIDGAIGMKQLVIVFLVALIALAVIGAAVTAFR